MKVTVGLKMSPAGDFITVLGPVEVEQPTPPLLKMGFAGVTGREHAYHEVRNVIVRTPGDLYVTKVHECDMEDRIVTVVGNNVNTDCNGITVKDTLPACFVREGDPVISPAAGGSLYNFSTTTLSDGRTVCSYTLDVKAQTPLFVTFNGHFNLPEYGQYVSSVGITPPNGFTDASTIDNRFTFTGTINILSTTLPSTNITQTPGSDILLSVTATNSNSDIWYTWERSLDNGVNWTTLISSWSESYTYTGQDALVRCCANWYSTVKECNKRDTLIFQLMTTPADVSVTKSAQCTGTKNRVGIQTVIEKNTITACNGIIVSDTLPAGFIRDDAQPVISPASGGSMYDFSTASLSDGRTLCTYTLKVSETPLFVTFNGHFDNLPANEQYVSGVAITPPTSFGDTPSPDNNRSTFTGKLGILSATSTDVTLTGNSTPLNVTATNSSDVTSYAWTQSVNNAASWTPLDSTTVPDYTYTGATDAFVRCIAQWDFDGCTTNRDTVIFQLTALPQAIDDHAVTRAGIPVKIGILSNDIIPAGCPTPVLWVASTSTLDGSATIIAGTGLDSVLYTPPDGLAGFVDTLAYGIDCKGNLSDAFIYITVSETPDNISDANCYIDPPATVWGIREVLPRNAANQVHNFGPLTAGDIDGNDTIMIIGFMDNHGTDVDNAALGYRSYGFKTFYFDPASQQIVRKDSVVFPTASTEGSPVSTFGSMAIARYNGTGYIVVAGIDRRLYAYRSNGFQLWRSEDFYNTDPGRYTTVVNIADFNHDGIPEVYAGNRIFSLATGNLLCYGGNNTNTGILYHSGGDASMAADIVPGGNLELCAGTQIYEVNIPPGATASMAGSMSVITELPASSIPTNASKDGATQVADIDGDGALEVVVITRHTATTGGQPVVVYVWKPLPGNASYLIGHYAPSTSANYSDYYSIPMIGDIDGDSLPEIVYIGSSSHMYALDYLPANAPENRIAQKWSYGISDVSAATGMTLFDFNNDGVSEIVYRDETHLHIINGKTATPVPEASIANVYSYTLREYPLIVDIDGDGQAEIVVSGHTDGLRYNGYVRVFKSNGSPWAPARKVWNQYAYNATNINDDLTVPRYPLNPAALFPGKDGQLGAGDDIRPYNNFRQQQTTLSTKGTPLWLTPDTVFDESNLSVSLIGDSVSVSLCIVNKGDAPLGNPVYASLYRDNADDVDANRLATDSLAGYILPGDTACLTVGVGHISSFPSFVQLVVRLNDNGKTYPAQAECNCSDSIRTRFNPVLLLAMKKDASIDSVPGNGIYPNPVSALFGDTIKYTITAINANPNPTGTLVIRDTLPAYLHYADGTADPADPAIFVNDVTTGSPPRDTLVWTFDNVPSLDTVKVTFGATLEEGASASQPMFINRAWVTISDTHHIPTANSTYHQGAGVSTVTFSSTAGGAIYNATPQALDFRTSPRTGILIVPDEGYRFTGWSHDAYISLRGEPIEARSGIMHYDMLTIYGDVELRAGFALEDYPVHYYLHGGENAPANPPSYTIQSAAVTLEAPHKADDIFTGWTGSNGDEPQLSVVIPAGSTGARDYYANYLYSGREAVENGTPIPEDKIWSFGDELHVRTDKTAAIIRIYSPEGMIIRQQTAIAAGETRIKLPFGIYIITLNNSVGRKVTIK